MANVAGIRAAGDLIARATGRHNAKWIYDAADEIDRLTAALTIAREALEFYADRSNYDCLEIGWWARAERALEEINQED